MPMADVRAVLLGVAQDGGRPHPGCRRPCCLRALSEPERVRHPTVLAAQDADGGLHLIDCSRAFVWQWDLLLRSLERTDPAAPPAPTSVTLTHAHLGHVDGLGLLGTEALDARDIRLHVSGPMAELIAATPAWRELVERGCLRPAAYRSGEAVQLGRGLRMTPIQVPHRDERADTHAILLAGPERRLLHLPDHDTWRQTLAAHRAASVRQWLASLEVDIALLDGTFLDDNELPAARQRAVPHPAVSETVHRLGPREPTDPEVVFIHLNHTNPLLDDDDPAHRLLTEHGHAAGRAGQTWRL